jgi:hypothetical protein
VTSGPSLLSRALAEPPLTGGLLPGHTCVWWRAAGWEDERRHVEALPWLLRPAGLSDDQREAVEDMLHSLVVAVGAPSGPDADPAEALDPIPCRIHRAVLAPDQAVPYLPPAVLAGHEAMLAFAVASVVGVPLGIALGTRIAWQAPFFALAAIGLPLVGLAAWALPAEVRSRQLQDTTAAAEAPADSGKA